eukprot:4180123-Amphidinium_carterae.1
MQFVFNHVPPSNDCPNSVMFCRSLDSVSAAAWDAKPFLPEQTKVVAKNRWYADTFPNLNIMSACEHANSLCSK